MSHILYVTSRACYLFIFVYYIYVALCRLKQFKNVGTQVSIGQFKDIISYISSLLNKEFGG